MKELSVKEKNLALKSRGIIKQKDGNYYSIRFLSRVGYFSSEEFIELGMIAKKYGNGEVSLTSRLTVEIPYIKEGDIENVVREGEEKGLRIGGGGPKVRAVISCKGSVCSHGLINTRKLSEEIEKEFLGIDVPGKFKIGVFGCVNSYGKAQSNDLSILPVKKLVDEDVEFLVFLGGRLGRKSRLAVPMEKRFKEEELIPLIRSVINYYNKYGNKKERFAELIERIGLQEVENSIIFNLKNK